MSKHTPGPWLFETEDAWWWITNPAWAAVAKVCRPEDFVSLDDDEQDAIRPECMANGQLIAAAPDYHAAAEAIRQHMAGACNVPPRLGELIADLLAAHAKADGRQA